MDPDDLARRWLPFALVGFALGEPAATAIHDRLDVRGACTWGLASGVGFGVAEGIMYSSDFYNGVHGGEIYLVRFVSCVALHAVWSATVAMAVHARREDFQGERRWFEYGTALLRAALVPMVLHGLYDTLLKKGLNGPALIVAVASFGWLVVRVEQERKRSAAAPPLPA